VDLAEVFLFERRKHFSISCRNC